MNKEYWRKARLTTVTLNNGVPVTLSESDPTLYLLYTGQGTARVSVTITPVSQAPSEALPLISRPPDGVANGWFPVALKASESITLLQGDVASVNYPMYVINLNDCE